MAMSRDALFNEVKSRLAGLFGPRLRGVLLFGSEARGTARPDSDIDLLVVLEGDRTTEMDLSAIVRALSDLNTEYQNRCLTAFPVSVATFEAQQYRALRTAKREGIWL